MAKRHISGKAYVLTYVALLVLATLTLVLSWVFKRSGLGGGAASLAVAIGIAAVKAFLVLWFFMHLAEQRFANRLVVLVSVTLLGILIALTATDVATRHTFPPAPRPTPSAGFYER
ncbi:MAG TPA: cytochrome C oxidase subunit IV family protein [Polyangia bacterium]|jgi:cytochrome c oxidase subunit 4|nr:cytochrome C oxidase subunit IV family protein [Polyangia bacterium]